ncbi:MAG: SMP-30/gluconolactonase/LRE family protein [Sedimentisphaerales bacterium]|nr:SMP-30/gluconolactonase/LRE family protein [Sedimentisphaerales bacterium]
MSMRSIGNPNCHLAECPVWNGLEGVLYWTDILEKRIWRYRRCEEKVELIWQGQMMVGGLAFTVSNDLVLCTDRGVYRLRRDERGDFVEEPELLYEIALAADERFNDVTTDPAGRVFAGTLTERRSEGKLYRLEKSKKPVVVLRDLQSSNGMTFSLDEKYFFHTDSQPRTITRYDYDVSGGEISHGQVIYQGKPENGKPDGITLDGQGGLWVACWGAAKVIRLDQQGEIVGEIAVPGRFVSSVNFGGEQMDELFVTSACPGAVDVGTGVDAEGNYLGGQVYCEKVSATGREEWRAGF